MLAALVLHERVAPVQRLGVALTLAGCRADRGASAQTLKRMFSTSPSRIDVGLALEPLEAAAGDLGVRARLDELLPVDHLAADEAARDVGVDRRGRVERGLAVAGAARRASPSRRR